jgi:hypothetical protein
VSKWNITCLTTVGLLWIGAICTTSVAQSTGGAHTEKLMNSVNHLADYQVIEFRRYTIKAGEREHFIQYFEAFFPEAIEQLGALVLGQFAEREDASHFLWLRGFHSTYDRPVVNSAFYFGPLWREHRTTLNDLMVDSDNVLLLRPLHADRGPLVLPVVDPVSEAAGATGIVVTQIFPIKKQTDEHYVSKVDEILASYRAPGVREAGILITLEAPNNFPQLPVRTDGPYLIWIGVVKDDATLTKTLSPLMQRGADSLKSQEILTGAPEIIVSNPTHRSRLRWLSSWNQ